MSRIALTDDTGSWFDESRARFFEEASIHDGRNYISKATGSQWEHEGLYRTANGRWVLNCWSNYQGSTETYELIDDRTAAGWLVRNEHEPHEACAAEFAELEL